MNDAQFKYLAGYFKEQSGLVLTQEKIYLVESRLLPVAKRFELENLDDFITALKANRDQDLIRAVSNAMTINETFFFRDTRPFDLFRETVLPDVIERRRDQKKIRIWSAAAAVGQEPYSIAMILQEEKRQMPSWNLEIFGTDLSTYALDKAKSGIYTEFEVQRGLPPEFLTRYFTKIDPHWQVTDTLKQIVKYQQYNLLHPPTGFGIFDVVFCRNVLIYFDEETKGKVLAQIRSVMAKDGLLFLGGAETVVGITDLFAPIQGQRGVYQIV